MNKKILEKTQTEFSHIHEMDKQQLADFLSGIFRCDGCPAADICKKLCDEGVKENCRDTILRWLNSDRAPKTSLPKQDGPEKVYTLIQAPPKENTRSTQISIIDENTRSGKNDAEALTEEGYVRIGSIKSRYSPPYLEAGFTCGSRGKCVEYSRIFGEISRLADSHIEI